ncbi:hypothetical protein M426DRAFT_316425 [Hypoxylon sp. CI-4A]|nr:hypothetical protein M426DRAFT_316425 [Hypoxylon sp. CI-4A]
MPPVTHGFSILVLLPLGGYTIYAGCFIGLLSSFFSWFMRSLYGSSMATRTRLGVQVLVRLFNYMLLRLGDMTN